jgi:flagellar hook protein FlgE
VDLSEEFINLIIASTGFSASSRVITTADQLLTELLNTSR